MTAIIACKAPYGRGGLGQHFQQLVEAARAQGTLQAYYCVAAKPGDQGVGHVVPLTWTRRWINLSPFRSSLGWRTFLVGHAFDRAVAQHLSVGADRLVAFVGKAEHTFLKARELGITELHLHVGNSHVDQIRERHARALNRYGMEDSWLHERHRQKALREYALANVIWVNSDYTRDSFLSRGFEPDRIRRVRLEPPARFQPPEARPDDGVFRIVYTGSLFVTKGIPLLREAYQHLEGPKELRLVGAWSTRVMRKFIEAWCAEDPTVTAGPADPLPFYQRADVCVHPSFEDGFAYAPAEALACGTPAIVTEDTGMKEWIREGVNGFVVPTGDIDALVDRLRHVRRQPLATTSSLIPRITNSRPTPSPEPTDASL